MKVSKLNGLQYNYGRSLQQRQWRNGHMKTGHMSETTSYSVKVTINQK